MSQVTVETVTGPRRSIRLAQCAQQKELLLQQAQAQGSEGEEVEVENVDMFIRGPTMKRLAHVSGIEKMSRASYGVLLKLSENLLSNIIRRAQDIASHCRKTTVSSSEVLEALHVMNIRYYGDGDDPNYFSVKSMPVFGKKPTANMKPDRVAKVNAARASARMKWYSQHENELFLARKPLARKIKQLCDSFALDRRISRNAINIMQEILENKLVAILSAAHLAAKARDAITVQERDIEAALKMCMILGSNKYLLDVV